jgi:hypothetical protein
MPYTIDMPCMGGEGVVGRDSTGTLPIEAFSLKGELLFPAPLLGLLAWSLCTELPFVVLFRSFSFRFLSTVLG